MTHFAKVLNGIVTQVIVAEPEFFNTFVDSSPGEWIETCYGAFCGKDEHGNVALRKNYAGIGYKYDSARDAFIPPCQYKKWVLNEETCIYEPPIPIPLDEKPYDWDDENGQWVENTFVDPTQTKVEILP
jgi:hypothetical protein